MVDHKNRGGERKESTHSHFLHIFPAHFIKRKKQLIVCELVLYAICDPVHYLVHRVSKHTNLH